MIMKGSTDAWAVPGKEFTVSEGKGNVINYLLHYCKPAVLNRLRLEDHLEMLSPGRGLPLKIVPWKIVNIGLFVCLYFHKIKRSRLCSWTTRQKLADHKWSADHRLRTAVVNSYFHYAGE